MRGSGPSDAAAVSRRVSGDGAQPSHPCATWTGCSLAHTGFDYPAVGDEQVCRIRERPDIRAGTRATGQGVHGCDRAARTRLWKRAGTRGFGATAVDMKLEVVAVPVSDVDRAKDLYQSLGWRLDADFVTGPDFRVIQMHPARLGLRDHFRHRDHIGRARFGAGPHRLPAVPRDIRAGGIRLPDRPGGGAAPRAAVAHGKHEQETPISSAQRCPSGARSGRRRRRARRAHHYEYRGRGRHLRHRRRPAAHSDI